jgi:uncharacterized protein YjiS (DUF1127 family)
MSTNELPISENVIAPTPTALSNGLWAILARAVTKTWECIAAYLYRRALRRTEAELMSLDDRLLRDIGLTRSEIPAAVRRAEAHHLMSIVPR